MSFFNLLSLDDAEIEIIVPVVKEICDSHNQNIDGEYGQQMTNRAIAILSAERCTREELIERLTKTT
jgi:hypothetical protein